jgi:hypothetical protein
MGAMARAFAALGAAAALALLLRRLLGGREQQAAEPAPPAPRPDSDDPLERIESQVVASERSGG